jgi:hypothetical protein
VEPDLSSVAASIALYHEARTMKKAISITVTLWIEGEDEPAHDFAKSTSDAVRDMIQTAAGKYPGLAVTIRSIKEK